MMTTTTTTTTQMPESEYCCVRAQFLFLIAGFYCCCLFVVSRSCSCHRFRIEAELLFSLLILYSHFLLATAHISIECYARTYCHRAPVVVFCATGCHLDLPWHSFDSSHNCTAQPHHKCIRIMWHRMLCAAEHFFVAFLIFFRYFRFQLQTKLKQ